ncbi:MAG: hypothetical protein ACYDG6_11240 [Thermincolia bacterium]
MNMERNFEKGYCHICDNDVPVTLKKDLQDNLIKGIKVTTLIEHAICGQCGSEVYIAELNDANLDKIDQNFRQKTGRILASELKELLEKYQIGAKPLSLLLNWGECTIPRYLKGQIPNKEHSDKLKSLNHPHHFYDIFVANKEVLTGVSKNKMVILISI